MADETDLTLRRYGAALRRWWWIVVAPAAALAILLASTEFASGVGGEQVVEARFVVVDVREVFGEVIEEPPEPQLGFRGFSDLLASDQTESIVATQTGSSAEVTVRGIDDARIVVVTVRAESLDAATAMADGYVAFAREQRSADLTAVADQAREIIAAQRDAIDSRIDEIDQELQPIPEEDARAPRVEAMQTERRVLVGDGVELDERLAIVDRLASGDVDVINEIDRHSSETTVVVSTVYRVVIGAIAGAVIGVVAVLLIVGLSRRLRSAADVERVAGEGTVLGHAPATGRVSPLLAHALARRARDRAVYVFGLGGASTSTVCSSIVEANEEGAVTVVDGGSLDEPTGAAPLPVQADAVAGALIAVRDGGASPDLLQEALRAIRASEVALFGVVIQRRR